MTVEVYRMLMHNIIFVFAKLLYDWSWFALVLRFKHDVNNVIRQTPRLCESYLSNSGLWSEAISISCRRLSPAPYFSVLVDVWCKNGKFLDWQTVILGYVRLGYNNLTKLKKKQASFFKFVYFSPIDFPLFLYIFKGLYLRR